MLYSSNLLKENDFFSSEKRENPRILLVDDDVPIRNVLKMFLKDFGCNVVEAGNGKEALDLCLSYDFDLVLADYIMPVMDGIEFLKEMSFLEKKYNTPILLLTGSDDEKSHKMFFDNGADDIIFKPVQEHILKIKVESWLRTKNSLNEIEKRKEILILSDLQHEEDLLVSKKVIDNFTYFNRKEMRNIRVFEQATDLLSGDMVLAALSPSGNQNILLADFTGHGLPAAVGSMMVSQLFYAMTAKGLPIVEITREINKKLRSVLPTNRFMAACIVEINYVDNILSVIQAGLPEMYIFNGENELLNSIESKHVPLGVLSNDKLDVILDRFDIEKDTKIFIYSDGLNEAKNQQDKVFGKDQIIQSIESSYIGFSSFEDVRKKYKTFMDGYKNFDDVTFIQIICDQSLVSKKSEKLEDEYSRQSAEWSINYIFDMNVMREIDPIPLLVNQIENIQGTSVSREKLYLILTELYSNSLEHGILGLDSELKTNTKGFAKYYELREKRLNEITTGKIEFHINNKPTMDGGVLSINVIDNGQGFDQKKINLKHGNKTELKGRGITLIDSLTDNYHYEDNGRKAYLELSWDKAA